MPHALYLRQGLRDGLTFVRSCQLSCRAVPVLPVACTPCEPANPLKAGHSHGLPPGGPRRHRIAALPRQPQIVLPLNAACGGRGRPACSARQVLKGVPPPRHAQRTTAHRSSCGCTEGARPPPPARRKRPRSAPPFPAGTAAARRSKARAQSTGPAARTAGRGPPSRAGPQRPGWARRRAGTHAGTAAPHGCPALTPGRCPAGRESRTRSLEGCGGLGGRQEGRWGRAVKEQWRRRSARAARLSARRWRAASQGPGPRTHPCST